MDLSRPATLAAVVRRMVEESEKRAHRLAALREAVAAGTYSVSAIRIAEAILRSLSS
jgi:anti-sigma28 factor (negative regulator of flagellin synthesis)